MQVRGVDLAGNVSAWTPAAAGAGNTAKIDRTTPHGPTGLTGGSLNWSAAASVRVAASGATDSGGSGVTGYQYADVDRRGHHLGLAHDGSPTAVTARG